MSPGLPEIALHHLFDLPVERNLRHPTQVCLCHRWIAQQRFHLCRSEVGRINRHDDVPRLSAIAAGFSAWTAFQQKQATFDSVRFNKELEAASVVASEAAYRKQYIDTMMNESPERYQSGTPGAQFFIGRNKEIDVQELTTVVESYESCSGLAEDTDAQRAKSDRILG